MRVIYKILVILFIGFYANAQSGELINEVHSMLRGTNTQQLELYGYFENKFEIQLYLIHNDKEWKGICYYPSSNVKLILEGGKVDGKLVLNEVDDENGVIGMWQIELLDELYSAIWMNMSKTVNFELKLSRLNKENRDIDFRINSVESYVGNLINENYSITMFNIGLNDKKANILNTKKYLYLKNSVKCLNESCNNFDINIDKNNKNTINKLECSNLDGKTLNIKISNRFKTRFTSTIERTELFSLVEKSFINENFRIYFIYPKFKNGENIPFFIANIYSAYNKIKEELDRKIKNELDIDKRQQYFVNGWYDIDFISKDFFSGSFNIQKSYSNEIITIPIIYSFKNEEVIDIYKQFKSDFNIQFFISQFIKEKIKSLAKNRYFHKRGDLNPADFKYITLNKYGIVFSTVFSSIFGVDKIILPFSELNKKIKRKSILNKIMR